MPRTEHGHPNLQGYWTNASQTPLQRPEELGEKRFYTLEEAQELMVQAEISAEEKAADLDSNRGEPERGANILFQADENFANTRINLAVVDGEFRTSLIVDPPNGRLPFVAGGRSKDVFGEWRAAGAGALDGPEIRNPWERCVYVGGQVPPMIAWTYNANFQFVQNQDYVVIHREMVHDARIIPLAGEHFPEVMYQWMGNSVGRWEDDTLVVQTKNFHPQVSNPFIPSSYALEVTERFQMQSKDEIFYSYTIHDPVIYSQPVTVEMPLRRKAAGEYVYEYACHEGNYSLPSILAGARREELDEQLSQ
ncbi:MAG: hypothetical protein MI746_04990 [Pseudomonadales bacterium]|nr:hypothetical protein [Pseudomonadales bacterium]